MSKLYYGPVVGMTAPRTRGAGRTVRTDPQGWVTITVADDPYFRREGELPTLDDTAPEDGLEARELTVARWTDFEALFAKYGGVQAGCWCMFYHRSGPNRGASEAARQEQNRKDHGELLRRGHAHGVLVYRRGSPVGWCQFGLREDLPRVDGGRKYRALVGELDGPPRWRITCFFVDRPVRREGVARHALHAALEAIQRRGGGVVEGYPATHARAVGIWFGTTSMFEREGFRIVRPFGNSNVLVRRTLPALASKRRRKVPS